MFASLREIWRFRALVSALTARHVAQRYRGSLLGYLWSLLNPLCLMLVYTLVFAYYIRFSEVENYTAFLFVGLLPWLWFTSALSEGTTSVVSSGHLITKSMFPAQVLPTVAVLSSMINFLLTLPVLFLFLLLSGIGLGAPALLLPVVILLQLFFLVGASLILAALNVQYRDVQHVVANVLTLLFFLSPILYPVEIVPARFQFTMLLNPLAVFTSTYHQLLFQGSWPSIYALVYLSAWSLLVLGVGLLVFNRYRENFAESL